MAHSIEQQTPVSQQQELLMEIEAKGTPLRLDGPKGTYYVLSASQLRKLLGRLVDDFVDVDDVMGFALEDFGLTKADVAEYNEKQQAQRARVAESKLIPLPTILAERLSEVSEAGLSNSDVDDAERETLLRELEAAMLANLQAAVANDN